MKDKKISINIEIILNKDFSVKEDMLDRVLHLSNTNVLYFYSYFPVEDLGKIRNILDDVCIKYERISWVNKNYDIIIDANAVNVTDFICQN